MTRAAIELAPRPLPWLYAAPMICLLLLGLWCAGWTGFILWTLLSP